jgi:hypothetical protein
VRWVDLRPAAERLAKRWDLLVFSGGTSSENVVGRAVHEIAHCLDLQLNRSDILPTLGLQILLMAVHPEYADANEIQSLAAQEVWFARHGLGRPRTDKALGRGFLEAAQIKISPAAAAKKLAAAKASKRTALICDRIDEWFGLAPMRQRNRRPRAADPKQTALQLERVA